MNRVVLFVMMSFFINLPAFSTDEELCLKIVKRLSQDTDLEKAALKSQADTLLSSVKRWIGLGGSQKRKEQLLRKREEELQRLKKSLEGIPAADSDAFREILTKNPMLARMFKSAKEAQGQERKASFISEKERKLLEDLPGISETSESGYYREDELLDEILRRAQDEWTIDPVILTTALNQSDYATNISLLRVGRFLRAVAQTNISRLTKDQVAFVQAFNRKVEKSDIESLPEERLRRRLASELKGNGETAQILLEAFRKDPESFRPFYVGSHQIGFTSGLERRVYRIITAAGEEILFSMDGWTREGTDFQVEIMEGLINGEVIHYKRDEKAKAWERDSKEERTCMACHTQARLSHGFRMLSNINSASAHRDSAPKRFFIPE